jgi:hypothetical protein
MLALLRSLDEGCHRTKMRLVHADLFTLFDDSGFKSASETA